MQRLWYVAYGSNLSLARFRCYLLGGRPEGGARHYPGCRAQVEAESTVGLLIPGGIYFAGRSSVWGGGTAVYDAEARGQVAARGYLLTTDQLVDVLAQEMRRAPGTDLDLSPLQRVGRQSYGPGRYETLIRVGTRDDIPLVTLTTDTHDSWPLNTPTEPYLRTMATGLRESQGWTAGHIGSYLAAVPGAAGVWAPGAIERLVA